MVCPGRPYDFKFFKGCLPQILLGPFMNTLTQTLTIPGCFMFLRTSLVYILQTRKWYLMTSTKIKVSIIIWLSSSRGLIDGKLMDQFWCTLYVRSVNSELHSHLGIEGAVDDHFEFKMFSRKFVALGEVSLKSHRAFWIY